MKIGITSIQRNRGKWLKEWILFHRLVGVTNFYIYLHKCTDNSREIVSELSKRINIQFFELDGDIFRPQLAAFKHSYDNFGHEVDWMAFIDGDEFLYTPNADKIQDVLSNFSYKKLSALAVYWACYGSSGHITEPEGLILENFIDRAELQHEKNKHIKSIVKGQLGSAVKMSSAHFFNTPFGTYDELLRPINYGISMHQPSHVLFRINHYVTQSKQYFFEKKNNQLRPDIDEKRNMNYFKEHNFTGVIDESMQNVLPKIKDLMKQL